MTNFTNKLKIIFSDIKLQHTIFALPFAIMSAFLAAEGLPQAEKLFWIVVCMVTARSAAMSFNRIVDARFDASNPRTEGRALPSGKIHAGTYIIFLIASSLAFIFASAMLNKLALYLSPLALAIVFFYSLTKRFTAWSHFWLGIALSVAPVGAWVAIREEISLISLILGAAVVFWLIGFDIIYSCMDVRVDSKLGLHSIPQRYGVERALMLAKAAHGVMIVFLLALLWSPFLGGLYFAGVAGVAGLLWYEHSLVSPDDLSKVNVAFFNVNGWISLLLMALMIGDCLWV
ncbi:MAG: putative 4-hydroxybenzoate polyprenyltransferase [Nitrospinae bacterium]|jgi:4-hydroxybenzoate polyprenyltransferase|nr:putative 4-hydroxybenzoate polyprenyltransferase [Nitrospinota bacterium]MDA1108604.1 putative 4-hydroxybenzoate polyprenyltransferase [Nitrospinota bacterium]